MISKGNTGISYNQNNLLMHQKLTKKSQSIIVS